MGATRKANFSSEEFVTRLRDRDSDAIEELVRAYTEHLFRAALGLGFDSNNAHELVQTVWVTFFDVVPRFEARSHVRTFLFGILYNKASELRRDQARFDSSDPVEQVLEARFDADGRWSDPPVDPERFLLATETLGLIERCLGALPLNQRMAFYLREIEEHSSSDVCKILSVTTTNLGVLLYRARNRLRECIEGKVPASAHVQSLLLLCGPPPYYEAKLQ